MSDLLRASGVIGPILSGPTTRYNKLDGYQSEYAYEGTQAECQAALATLVAGRAQDVMLAPSGNGLWRVSGTFAGTPNEEGGFDADPPTNIHELDTVAEQVAWNKSDVARSYFNAARQEYIIAILDFHINKYRNSAQTTDDPAAHIYQNFVTELTASLELVSGITETADALKLAKHVIAYGIESFTNYRPIYYRTITAASYNQVQAAYTGVGKVWTAAEVVAFEGVPESEWFGLDTNFLWLKSPPRVSASAQGKTQISYQYTGALSYSKFQATAYGSATLLD